MASKKQRHIEALKQDINEGLLRAQLRNGARELERPDSLIELWRLLTRVKLLSTLQDTPVATHIMDVARAIDIDPERFVDLANIGEWIQVDRDTRHWNDEEESAEYWSCHYDGGQTVRGHEQIRTALREIRELEKSWMT